MPVGRATLHGVRLGSGGSPQLVFLHAGIADHRSWSGLLPLLAPDMDLVAYDQRGFGATTYAAEAHDQVADLSAVLDACGYGRPVLVGNSRGGQIALDFALTHPDRVAALVLLAPAVSGAPRVAASDLRPEEAAFWEELEAAEAAGDLDGLNRGEIRLWLDGLDAPEGRVTAAPRHLALDMNAIALSAASPGHEPRVVDALVVGGRGHLPGSRGRGRPRHEPHQGPLSRSGRPNLRRAGWRSCPGWRICPRSSSPTRWRACCGRSSASRSDGPSESAGTPGNLGR